MKTAKEAAQFLADQAVVASTLASKYEDSPMKRAIMLRSEIMMDCAKMIADAVKGK